jgi:hypothetical protein
MHLVYKDEGEALWYRHFVGQSFGPGTLLEEQGDWAMQPALTRIGNDLIVYYNRPIVTNSYYQVRARLFRGGAFSKPTVVDDTTLFKGYPAAVELLPTTVTAVPAIFGVTPTAEAAGSAMFYSVGYGAGAEK